MYTWKGLPDYIEKLEDYPLLVVVMKLLVATPFAYHYSNGLRHLVSYYIQIFLLKKVDILI